MFKTVSYLYLLRIVRIKSRVLYCSVVAAFHVRADPVEGDGGGGGDGGEPADDSYFNAAMNAKTKL